MNSEIVNWKERAERAEAKVQSLQAAIHIEMQRVNKAESDLALERDGSAKALGEFNRALSMQSEELARIKARKVFPIQRGPTVPWEVMAPHESMAQKNHSQSLQQLAERGGLDGGEAWCCISGIDLSKMCGASKEQWAAWSAEWVKYAERVNLHFDELARLQAAQGHMDYCRAILNVPSVEVLAGAIEGLKEREAAMREALSGVAVAGYIGTMSKEKVDAALSPTLGLMEYSQ